LGLPAASRGSAVASWRARWGRRNVLQPRPGFGEATKARSSWRPATSGWMRTSMIAKDW